MFWLTNDNILSMKILMWFKFTRRGESQCGCIRHSDGWVVFIQFCQHFETRSILFKTAYSWIVWNEYNKWVLCYGYFQFRQEKKVFSILCYNLTWKYVLSEFKIKAFHMMMNIIKFSINLRFVIY